MPMIDGRYAPPASGPASPGGGLGQAVALPGLGQAVSPSRSGRYGTTTMRSSTNNAAAARRSQGLSAPSGPPGGQAGPIQPIAPDIGTFLNQDSDYQNQLAQFANNLAQFMADATRRRGVTESDYNSSKKAMNDQKVIDLNNLEADYASRGVMRSGLYGKAVGDYNTEFNTRSTDLLDKEKQALGQLDQEQGRYNSQNTLQQEQAKQEAIRRRAEKYGV